MKNLSTSLNQLSIYLSKFKNRLSTEHSLHLKRLVSLLEAISRYAEEWKAARATPAETSAKAMPGGAALPNVKVMTAGELMTRLGRKVEGINLLEVEKYLRNSKVSMPAFLRLRIGD